jgi:hypothetical protein
MKIIIDRNNPLEVYDEEGHLLYIHQPIDDEDLVGRTSDELDALVDEAIREAKCYK